MTLTVETLHQIELDAAIAPALVVEHYARTIRANLSETSSDVAEHARALLLKLDHLVTRERAQTISPSKASAFLAPMLTIEEALRQTLAA
jgi:hypothetical protein